MSHSSISLTGAKDDPIEFKDALLLTPALFTVKAVGLSTSCYLIIKIANNLYKFALKVFRNKFIIQIINYGKSLMEPLEP